MEIGDKAGRLTERPGANGKWGWPLALCRSQASAPYHQMSNQRSGKPITRQGAWSRIRYAAHGANVPTGVQILRHTFCSHLAMQGAATRRIQEPTSTAG